MIGLRSCTALVLAVGGAALSGCAEQPDTAEASVANTVVGGDDRNGEYLPAIDWMKLDSNHKEGDVEWGDISSVSSLDPNRVYVVT